MECFMYAIVNAIDKIGPEKYYLIWICNINIIRA